MTAPTIATSLRYVRERFRSLIAFRRRHLDQFPFSPGETRGFLTPSVRRLRSDLVLGRQVCRQNGFA